MYFPNLGGPIALIVVTVFMFLLVPWERIQKIFPAAAVFGIALGTTTYYLLQNVVQAWHFQHFDLICLGGVPVFMILAWIPYSIIYFHLRDQYRSPVHHALLFLAAAATPAFFHYLLEINGMLVFQSWSWRGNFLYALLVFNGLAHLVYHRLKEKAAGPSPHR